MSNSVQERLKLKRITLDTWSTKEKLSLASSVVRSGDQNWSCVSRNIRMFAEPNRPPDWFSQKNCAQQYASLLENVETPKRKKRTAGSTEKTEVETPGESIVRKLTAERVEELKKSMIEAQAEYLRAKEEIDAVINGQADDRLPQLLQEIDNEKMQKELEKEAHIKWLKEREERKIELERAWKPGLQLASIRRASSMSEPSSEADSPLSEPLNVDVAEESVMAKPTPTSPLLTSLLKSPSTAAQSVSQATSSILHSAITSPHRGSSPTIASLLSSSPGLPGNLVMPPSNVSSSLKNLVSNAIAGPFSEEHKTVPQSPSQGAPTLSMLLELPPSMPGKPLPMLQPQPAAPPPYSEHLGPPPPYSQATEYLQQQKQRAEQRAEQLAQTQAQLQLMQAQAQQAQQAQQVTPTKTPVKEEVKLSVTPSEAVPPPVTPSTPTGTVQAQPIAARRASLKGRRLDLQHEPEADDSKPSHDNTTPVKPSPQKDKDAKRVHLNTSDHDYMESPVKEKESPAKAESKTAKETDVFEFDEMKEGYDKFDLMMKDSKMSYLKSNAQRLAMKKEAESTGHKGKADPVATASPQKTTEPKSYLRESEKRASPPRDTDPAVPAPGVNDEDIPLMDLVKKDSEAPETEAEDTKPSPAREREGKRGRSSTDSGREEGDSAAEAPPARQALQVSTDESAAGSVSKRKSFDVEPSKTAKEAEVKQEAMPAAAEGQAEAEAEKKKEGGSAEQSEDEKADEPEDSESAKEEDTLSHVTDTLKSEKADLSTTEDEKSNDANPKAYRRRGTASFSDSVPNSPTPFTEEEKEYKTWKKAVMLVHSRLKGHKFASLFLKPITDEQAPGYSATVLRPMDLSAIKRNIEMGLIRSTAEFQRDVMLMFVNALMYNKTNHHIYTMAKEMLSDSMEHFQMLLQATGDSAPSRRETRTQQSMAEVKIRGADKPSKGGKAVDAEKAVESRVRTNRSSLRSSPVSSEKGRTRNASSSEKTPALPLKRKRMAVSSSEGAKKRPKGDD